MNDEKMLYNFVSMQQHFVYSVTDLIDWFKVIAYFDNYVNNKGRQFHES